MNIRKNAFITLFFLLVNIVFSGMCVFANDVNVASAVFSSSVAETQNMTAGFSTGVVPVVETQKDITGWRLDASELRKANIRFDIDNDFMFNLKDENITVEISYYDDGHGGFALWYDAKGDKNQTRFVQLTRTNTWKTVRFNLYDAQFAGEANFFDFYIMTNDNGFATKEQGIMGKSPTDLLISSVKVIQESTISPFDISVKTGKPGNIFFEGDDIVFDVLFANRNYSVANATYTVKDYDENVVYTKSAPFANNKYKLKLSDIKFGVYTLDIAVNDGDISQVETIDFSYSKKAEKPRKQFGTNIHFQTAQYDEYDIRALADLAKNAGYYFIRTSHNWNEIEPKKGEYKLTDNLLYANKYLDQIGLEMLAILSCGNPLYAPWPYILDSDEEREAYNNFCYYTVDALKEYTDYFTSPNEFNLTSGEGGKHHADRYDEYSALVKSAYPHIKAANPNAYIVSGAVARLEREYIENCFNEGILDACDAFSIHVYDQWGDPETWYIFPEIQRWYDLLKSHDSSKEAWITENGWPTTKIKYDTGLAYSNFMPTELMQARFYARSFLVNSDPTRVEGYVHYCFNDANVDYFYLENAYGILESHDYRTPFAAKPAYITTAAVNSILNGYEFKRDLNHDNKDFVYNSGGAEYADGQDYSTHRFAYVYENDEGEEMVAVWSMWRPGEFTYESDKEYFEIYDMWGNKKVVENSTGSYKINYSDEPVYIKATDKFESGSVTLENTSSAWDIDESETLNVRVKMPLDAKIGDTASVVVAAYDENNKLICAKQSEVIYNKSILNAKIPAQEISNASYVKLLLFDGFSSLKPLLKANSLSEFDDNLDISYETNENVITLNGKLKLHTPYHNMTVTAWKESTSKEELINNYADAFLYQDMIMSDAHSNFEISFKIPENFSEAVRVQISGKDFVMQKTVYPVQ